MKLQPLAVFDGLVYLTLALLAEAMLFPNVESRIGVKLLPISLLFGGHLACRFLEEYVL